VEFRIDTLRPPIFDEIDAELSPFKERSIFTVRPAREGGGFVGSESHRLKLISDLAELNPLFLDVELRTLESNRGILSSGSRPKLIVSWHDVARTPGRAHLHSIMTREEEFGGLAKLVTAANDPADAIPVLSLYDRPGRPPIAFCMGVNGIFSRVMAMQRGSPVAYASLGGESTAPGQLSLGQMLSIRRRLHDA
jgi:3-dehydroquinate dehydratase I